MPHVDANGQRLYYEVHGEGDPLLLVMGLSADTLAWALQIPEFAKRHRVVVFDNRDVGQSSYADTEYEIADMADDALALADALELDDFNLLGLSMGGAISQEVILKAPERVKTLTLVVTWGGSGFAGAERTRFWSKQVDGLTREEHVDNLLLQTMSEQFLDNEQARTWLRGMMLANPNPQTPAGFKRQLAACGRHETRDRLGRIGVPTHVIGGEHDILVPVWKSKELADLIPGAKLSVLADAPHGVNLERAEELNRLVLGFLADHAAAPA